MVVNTYMHCMICEHCQIALHVDDVPGHLYGKHRSSGFQVDVVKLKEAAQEKDGCEELLLLGGTAEVYAEVSGVLLQQGLQCPECKKVLGTENSMARHYSVDHKGVKKPKVFRPAHYQQLNQGSGPGRAIFQVEPMTKKPASLNDVLVSTLRAETDEAFQEDIDLADINARQVSPWLLTTKWHLHVDGYDAKELIELVKPLNDKENDRLVSLVKRYYDQAIDLIDQTDCLTLQHLNSPEPTSMYVNYNLVPINVSN